MLQEIKQKFFVYRNGILADQLRAAGNPYKVIFGLNIPQIAALARELEPSMQLADELWADASSREVRLLATYLFPPDEVSREKARELMSQIASPEEADMLAFRLLKRLPFAAELLEPTTTGADDASSPLQQYARKALARHLE